MANLSSSIYEVFNLSSDRMEADLFSKQRTNHLVFMNAKLLKIKIYHKILQVRRQASVSRQIYIQNSGQSSSYKQNS